MAICWQYVRTNVNEFLLDQRILNEDIENEFERLEAIKEKAHSVSGVNISGMPKNQSYVSDRTADFGIKVVDLENEIKELIRERNDRQKLIECMAKMLKKPTEKAVVKMRYIDSAEWEEITNTLFGGKDDFNYKCDSYQKRVFRAHKNALENLEAARLKYITANCQSAD